MQGTRVYLSTGPQTLFVDVSFFEASILGCVHARAFANYECPVLSCPSPWDPFWRKGPWLAKLRSPRGGRRRRIAWARPERVIACNQTPNGRDEGAS